MNGIVVTGVPRTPLEQCDQLGRYGVATIHEVQARTGLLAARLRPVYRGAGACGSAVTVSVPPADNWMIHVAIEQCQEGDILVVAPTSQSDAGYFGELLATTARAHGVRGLVIDAGVRDTAELEQMRFPAWSKCVCAQGTVKQQLGTVNTPIVCAGQLIGPGDAIVADADGIVAVPRASVPAVIVAAEAREEKEKHARERYMAGELGLDMHDMRDRLKLAGLCYVPFEREKVAS